MSVDYTIIAPADAPLRAADSDYEARTPLGTHRAIVDWFFSHAPEECECDVIKNELSLLLGGTSRVRVVLHSHRYWRMWRRDLFIPSDRDEIVDLYCEFRGSGGNSQIITDCATWLNAVIFDHQSSEILTPPFREL